jgi:hypothetical protein
LTYCGGIKRFSGCLSRGRLDENTYDKGIKVSDFKMTKLNIKPADFYGEWYYTIQPRKPNN